MQSRHYRPLQERAVTEPGKPSPEPLGEDKENTFLHHWQRVISRLQPLVNRENLCLASAIQLGAHQNWGNKSLCEMTWQRLNKAMQLWRGRGLTLVGVPAPGRRGFALSPPLPGPAPGTPGQEPRRGKERGNQKVPCSRQVPGALPVRRFPRAGSKEAHAARRFLWECPRRTRRDTAPKSTAGHAEPTRPGQGQGQEPPGACGAWPRRSRAAGRSPPAAPIVWPRPRAERALT